MPERLSPRESLLASRFDLVMVMGSPFELNSDGSPYYPLFNSDLGNQNQDGDLKAQAIQQLYLSGMTPKILVTGGLQDEISRAEALVRHINLQYGVPLEFMIPLTSAPHSLGNLEETINYLKSFSPLDGEFEILTISAHLRRTREMAEFLKIHHALKKNPRYLSVEFILQAAGRQNSNDARNYYKSEEMTNRIASEHQGIIDLKANKYTPRS